MPSLAWAPACPTRYAFSCLGSGVSSFKSSFQVVVVRDPLQLHNRFASDTSHTWYPANTTNDYLQVKHFNNAPKDIETHFGNYSVRDLNAVSVAKINSMYDMGDLFVFDLILKYYKCQGS